MTTTPLYPVVPMHPDETTASYVSRLARLHGTEMRFFCLDMDFTRQSVADGDETTMGKISYLTDTPFDLLRHNALKRVAGSERVFMFRSERITGHFLRRQADHFCPACLKDDITGAAGRPGIAAYSRVPWQFDSIRTCPIHEIELVEPTLAKQSHCLDFAVFVAPHLEHLDELIERATPRPATALEHYLIDRIENGKSGQHWLDNFEIPVAAGLVEMIGAVVLQGSDAKRQDLSGSQRAECGAAGFVHAASLEAFLGFLQDVHEANHANLAANLKPQGSLGCLYKWLYAQRDPSFEPLKDIIADFAITVLPLPTGYNVLGRKVSERLLHSVFSAAVDYSIHPKTLRKVLTALDVIPAAPGRTDHQLIFEAKTHAPLLEKIATSKCAEDLQAYLGASRVHAKLILDHEFVAPFTGRRMAGSSLGEHLFAHDDLDDFLKRLLSGAEQVDATPKNAYPIADAARRANCAALEVFQLILDKKLKWTGKLVHVHGVSGVLVDLDEIKAHVRGKIEEGLLTSEDIARLLEVSIPYPAALITHGVLPHQIVTHPVHRCPVRVVPRSDVERFDAKYIFLSSLSRLSGIRSKRLIKMLADVGIMPVFDDILPRAKIYDRAAAMKEILSE